MSRLCEREAESSPLREDVDFAPDFELDEAAGVGFGFGVVALTAPFLLW